jgi:hypothetical protein
MVMENFTHYNMYENKMKNRPDEIVYQRMQESSYAIRKTESGDLYYDAVYSPQIPYKPVYSSDWYTKDGGLISHYDVVNNNEMNKDRIFARIKKMLCCR